MKLCAEGHRLSPGRNQLNQFQATVLTMKRITQCAKKCKEMANSENATMAEIKKRYRIFLQLKVVEKTFFQKPISFCEIFIFSFSTIKREKD